MSENAEGKYVYCIIRSSEPREFSTLGIGERGDVVHAVTHHDLAAVVSDSPIIEYENTRRNMMAHTLVLEEVMEEFDILPVRFGTVAPNEETISERLLGLRHEELDAHLQEMEGRVELGLKAFWYEGLVFDEILEENRPIRELRDSLMGRPAEETYRDRIRLGEMIEGAMREKRAEDSQNILSRLRPLAHDVSRKEEIIDRMVLNAAFLVDEDRQPAFDDAIDALDEEMGERLIFKYVGPVPPYNFVSIVVTWEES